MKKGILIGFSLVFAIFILGCASGPAAVNEGPTEVPEWVLNPPAQTGDVIYGIGSAKLSSTNQSMTFAAARARQSLAFQISTNVQAMLTDYARDAGTTNDTTALQLSEQVGRQLTDTKLVGATPVKQEQTKDGTWWALISYNKNEAAKLAADVIDNEAARYAEFKSMEALKLMDQQLDRISTKPSVVDK
jgi:hypothetical protein